MPKPVEKKYPTIEVTPEFSAQHVQCGQQFTIIIIIYTAQTDFHIYFNIFVCMEMRYAVRLPGGFCACLISISALASYLIAPLG